MDFFFTLIGVPPLPTEMPMLRIFSFRLNIFKQLQGNGLDIFKMGVQDSFSSIKELPNWTRKDGFFIGWLLAFMEGVKPK